MVYQKCLLKVVENRCIHLFLSVVDPPPFWIECDTICYTRINGRVTLQPLKILKAIVRGN